MPTLVVNIRLDPFDVYIGRAGHGHDGYFGNPFKTDHRSGGYAEAARWALDRFERYFLDRISREPDFRARVLSLRGQRLGCFCAKKGGVTAADKPWCCHG